ncbi:MAG: LysM peptidoglycan-binding domain-containing protein [Chloroflexi bacterium]|nr:LysM peptidoglycan-binding domain-containing protein [Chloroflexota bacterium]
MKNRSPISSSSSGLHIPYRKRKNRFAPNIITILAGLFILGGIALLIVWLAGPSKPINALFATDTPTPTMTFTPTNTSTPTETPTITPTYTITPTATSSTPFNYIVQEGEYLAIIVEKFNLGDNGIALIYLLNPYNAETGIGINPATGIVNPGQVILLPNPGMELPTATPIPPGLPRGTKLQYIIQTGDTLAGIAALFNSTTEEIIKENNIADPNAIQVGQLLVVPANLVTATATRPPTSTPIPPGPGTTLPTLTFTPIN